METNTNQLPMPAFFRITTADGQWIHYYPRWADSKSVSVERAGRTGVRRLTSFSREDYLGLLASATYIEETTNA